MAARFCGVWAIHKTEKGRLRDDQVYGHKKHVCVRTREFAEEHEGDHKCSCGITYAKQKTDND